MLAEQIITLGAGIVSTLIGYRVLGPRPGRVESLDRLHQGWVKHLKWLGPLLVVLAAVQLLLPSATRPAVDATSTNRHQQEELRLQVADEGVLAQAATRIASADGFQVTIPEGYTYSKPTGAPMSLLAIKDADEAATPAVAVVAVGKDAPLDQFMKYVMRSQITNHPNTRFSDPEPVSLERDGVYHVRLWSEREEGIIEGGLAFFESQNRVFMLTYGTLSALFPENEETLAGVVRSFGPIED